MENTHQDSQFVEKSRQIANPDNLFLLSMKVKLRDLMRSFYYSVVFLMSFFVHISSCLQIHTSSTQKKYKKKNHTSGLASCLQIHNVKCLQIHKVYVCKYIYIYIYTHMYIYTHIYSYTHILHTCI